MNPRESQVTNHEAAQALAWQGGKTPSQVGSKVSVVVPCSSQEGTFITSAEAFTRSKVAITAPRDEPTASSSLRTCKGL